MTKALGAVLLGADFTEPLTPLGGHSSGPLSRWAMDDSMLVVAGALPVVILVVVWAIFFRKRSRHSHRGRGLTEKSELVKKGMVEGASGRRKVRYRRRRREHRSSNPSLAETGGLPPDQPGEF